MKVNVGGTDRIIRLVIAAVAVVLALTAFAGSALGIVMWVVAAIMAVTAVVRFCPLYAPFGLSTCKAAAQR
jgi:type IV secretory pathway TrbD component